MTAQTRGRSGLTLVEVLIAMAVITIGIFAAIALLGSTLRASGQTQITQVVSKVAEAELTLRRHATSTVGTGTCITVTDAGYTCTVTVVACSLAASTFTCNSGVTDTAARLVTVTVAGPRDHTLTISSLVQR